MDEPNESNKDDHTQRALFGRLRSNKGQNTIETANVQMRNIMYSEQIHPTTSVSREYRAHKSRARLEDTSPTISIAKRRKEVSGFPHTGIPRLPDYFVQQDEQARSVKTVRQTAMPHTQE
jgi:hypothetical protein